MTDLHDPARHAGELSPAADSADQAQGHWTLARLGKRVLRPGGAELTSALLRRAHLHDADVIELAPGYGRTAAQIIASGVRSYIGVDEDRGAAAVVRKVVGLRGIVMVANAARTGLPDDSADVVISEAMLTMQGDRAKRAVVREACRLLRGGGRCAIHELALTPDVLPDATRTRIQLALARTIRVNSGPLTVAEWRALLESHGLVVDHVDQAPVALLQLHRLVSDEGVLGATRFVANVLAHPSARRRVVEMRRTIHAHEHNLCAVAIVTHRPR